MKLITTNLSLLGYQTLSVGFGLEGLLVGFGIGFFILGVEFELDFEPVDAIAVSLLKPTSEKNLLTFP